MTMTAITQFPEGLEVSPSRVQSWRVRANHEIAYSIQFSDDVLDPSSPTLLSAVGDEGRSDSRRRFVVIDSQVERHYGARIREYFDRNDIEARYMVVGASESVKNIEILLAIVKELDAFGIDRRREPLIVFGGGVLLDIVGLVAHLYRRGTPFVRVPTTLIGLVDAGVGVKTAINFNGNKNRLGTYYHGSLTLLDPTFLKTLDIRHISNGLAEILKIALVKDTALFELLETTGRAIRAERLQAGQHHAAARETIERAIHGMLEELQPNLWEAELERVVDYGHTFSPTIEMHALPALLHGEAVCIDMALTSVIAQRRGLISAEGLDRILNLMEALELPTWDDCLTPELLQRALAETVKHRDGQQRLPLGRGIGGCVFVDDLSDAELSDAVQSLRARAQLSVELAA